MAVKIVTFDVEREARQGRNLSWLYTSAPPPVVEYLPWMRRYRTEEAPYSVADAPPARPQLWGGAHVQTAYIYSVQKVSITIPNNATTATAVINPAVGIQFIVWDGELTSTSNNISHATCYLTISGNTITATRGAQANTDSVTVLCSVVDADPTNAVKSVQTGTITIGSGSTSGTASISAVTTANAVLHMLGWTASISAPNASPVISYLTTTVTASIGASFVGTMTVAYEVVEFQAGFLKSATQKIQKSFTTSVTSITQSITSVVSGNTMLFYCGNQLDSSAYSNQDWCTQQLTAANTITYTVQTANSAATKAYCYVCEFIPEAMRMPVQRGTVSIASSTSGTATVTPTGQNGMVNFLGWNTNSSSINQNNKYADLSYTSPTVTGATSSSTSTNVTVSYEVVDWVVSVPPPDPLAWLHRPPRDDAQVDVYRVPSYAYLFSVAPAPPTVDYLPWLKRLGGLEAPQDAPAAPGNASRLLGPQPARLEFLTWVSRIRPEAEPPAPLPDQVRNVARIFSPQPSRAEYLPWRRRQVFEEVTIEQPIRAKYLPVPSPAPPVTTGLLLKRRRELLL
jgi:hypothetical protein